MFGSGVGTKGAGGPGILQTFGSVAVAIPLLPLVTGVFGGLIVTVAISTSVILLDTRRVRRQRWRAGRGRMSRLQRRKLASGRVARVESARGAARAAGLQIH